MKNTVETCPSQEPNGRRKSQHDTWKSWNKKTMVCSNLEHKMWNYFRIYIFTCSFQMLQVYSYSSWSLSCTLPYNLPSWTNRLPQYRLILKKGYDMFLDVSSGSSLSNNILSKSWERGKRKWQGMPCQFWGTVFRCFLKKILHKGLSSTNFKIRRPFILKWTLFQPFCNLHHLSTLFLHPTDPTVSCHLLYPKHHKTKWATFETLKAFHYTG